jgi:hypothetical protein
MAHDSTGQAGALSQDVEITPAMLDEGIDAFLSFDLAAEEARTVVREVYRRMTRAARLQSAQGS